MGVIKALNETSDKAIDFGELYYKKTQEYYKLKVFQQVVLLVGMFVKTIAVGSLLFLGIIFFAIAGTIALTEILNSAIVACLIIGGALLLLSFLVYALRSKLDAYVVLKSSKNFFD